MKHELFSGRKPNFAHGEAGVVTTADRKIKDKVDMLVMFIVCMIR